MARVFKLPDLGEGIHEGEIIAVLVAVGDTIEEGTPILEVETDKAAVEIPSPFSGTVVEIRVKPGDTVAVGEVMMTFSNGDTDRTTTEPREAVAADSPAVEVTVESETAPIGDIRHGNGPVPASPATRRLARELGVDLRRVSPSGPGGLVTADDVRVQAQQNAVSAEGRMSVESAVESAKAQTTHVETAALPDFSKWGPIELTPLKSIRKATARQMAQAWSQIPHVSSQDEIDVTRLEALRRRHKPAIAALGGKLTLTVFAVKAAAAALKQLPQFRVSLDGANGQIIHKKYTHIGVATDTGDGLVVPVLRDVDRKSITEIAVEMTDLVQRTRNRKIGLEELQGGTFTITNIGAAGGRGHFAPIINYPEAAILGMSAARLKPVVIEKTDGRNQMVARLMMPVVLAIDHRLLDGVDSARFLDYFRRALEDPEKLLLSI